MNRIFLLLLFPLACISCDREDTPRNNSDADNTEINVRDRNSDRKTPFEQSESESDIKITQKVRQAIMADNSLSTNAKNIKIITISGVVTLRGPVANSQEIESITNKLKNIQGITKVDNQLEVSRANN